MNNKMLGYCGLFCAPWLYIGTTLEMEYAQFQNNWFSGAWGIIYITGWIGLIIALQRIKATGESPFGRAILWVLLASLVIADISNVVRMIDEKNKPAWFFYIDLFWPVSNIIMLITGIVVIRANIVQGWQRFVPLLVGLWLPLAMASMKLPGLLSFIFGGFYSAIAWSLLAMVVLPVNRQSGSAV